MNLIELLPLFQQHSDKQKKYFGVGERNNWADMPIELRAKFIQKVTSYLIEECVELEYEESVDDYDKALLELADIFIYGMGLAAVSGVNLERLLANIHTEIGGIYTPHTIDFVRDITEINRTLNHLYKPFKAEKEVNERELMLRIAKLFCTWFEYANGVFDNNEALNAVYTKLNYNTTRADHSVNA